METKTIVRVNNVDIIATSDEQMIAIRPICEALGLTQTAKESVSNGTKSLVQLRS